MAFLFRVQCVEKGCRHNVIACRSHLITLLCLINVSCGCCFNAVLPCEQRNKVARHVQDHCGIDITATSQEDHGLSNHRCSTVCFRARRYVFVEFMQTWVLAPVSIPSKSSYRKSREVSKLRDLYLEFSYRSEIWQATSAALLSRCLSSFKTMRQSKLSISRLRDFTRSYDKTHYLILKRGTGQDKEQDPKSCTDFAIC